MKETIKHGGVDVDDMTKELWKTMTVPERSAWSRSWRKQGIFFFACLRCGFPTAYGTSGCEACR